MTRSEMDEAIGAIDELLATVGLEHGRRESLKGTWKGGERVRRSGQTPARKRVEEGVPTKRRNSDVLMRAPGWEKLGWLAGGFSLRSGGVSSAYGSKSLNLGWKEEDSDENVRANRERYVKAIEGSGTGGGFETLVTPRQFHSGMIRTVRTGDEAIKRARKGDRTSAALRGDGLLTDVPGILIGVQIADCVPVLVADAKQRAVGVFHAGWRGTLARIVERGVGTMRLEFGSRPEDLLAAVGPSIGACCYSVGEEVRHEFESQFEYAPELFSEVYDSDPVRDKYPLLFLTARAPGHSNIGPQLHLNLWEANRRQLLAAGVREERISMVAECTNCARDSAGARKFFSHRGEHGFTGRMMGAIGVRNRT